MMKNYQFNIAIFLSSFSIIFFKTKLKDNGLTYSLSILVLISFRILRVLTSNLRDEYAQYTIYIAKQLDASGPWMPL